MPRATLATSLFYCGHAARRCLTAGGQRGAFLHCQTNPIRQCRAEHDGLVSSARPLLALQISWLKSSAFTKFYHSQRAWPHPSGEAEEPTPAAQPVTLGVNSPSPQFDQFGPGLAHSASQAGNRDPLSTPRSESQHATHQRQREGTAPRAGQSDPPGPATHRPHLALMKSSART